MPIDTARRPEMRWVPVTDQSGRTWMEAVWLSPDQVAAPTAPTASSAPAVEQQAPATSAPVTHAA